MIFIALGTQKFQLNRLLQEVDRCIEEGRIQDQVFAQIGNSDYIPKYYSYCRFLDQKQYEEKIHECTILLTHSGVGTIIEGVRLHKKIIVYPRLAKYHEHVDDHQIEIGMSFYKRGLVVLCNDGDDIVSCIERSSHMKMQEYVSANKKMVAVIKQYLED